jgi:hypothetical protein
MTDQSPTTATDTTEPTDTNEPTIDDETQRQAEKEVEGIDNKYEPGSRPTVVLPGTGGMVSGTAFADMVDENGELKDDQTSND